MLKETMTGEERINAAINLDYVDRVPVAPTIGQFAIRHKKYKDRVYPSVQDTTRVNAADYSRLLQVVQDTFDDLGGYDGHYVAGAGFPVSSWRLCGIRMQRVLPGTEGIPADFSVQTRETEVITIEDYDTIINRGWNGFLKEYLPRRLNLSIEQVDMNAKRLMEVHKEGVKLWKKRGVFVFSGAVTLSCEMALSLGRTLPQFTLDLYRRPDKVKAAMEVMASDYIQNVIDDTRSSGIPRVVISLERGSGSYYSLDMYERFFFPQLKKMVEAFAAAGLVTILHFDTDWTLNMPYLLDLPKKMCICELDSITDIFKAKEILKGHMCIKGDVPPSLLSLGTQDEVVEYCEKLIDIIGKDGGFILSTGCECPIDARFDNVKAMIDTAKSYPGLSLKYERQRDL